jgi:hypothetical protein
MAGVAVRGLAARIGAAPLPRGSARAAGLLVVVAGIGGGFVARAAGVDLQNEWAPFFGEPEVAAHVLWPLPTVVAAFFAGLALLRYDRLSSRAFLLGAFGLALCARLGLAVAQKGVSEWWWPIVRGGADVREYPAAYPLVSRDPLGFVDHFAELVPTLPVHPSGHPVGATLAFWGLDRLVGGPHGSAIALCVLGAATVAPLLWLGRALADERAARCAVVLFALAPDTLIYGATSYDAAFVPVAVLAAWLLLTRRVVAGAVVSAGAFLVSYALALAPLWAALTAGRRGGLRIALASAAAGVVALALLALTLGYDPVDAVRATRDAYLRGVGGRRPERYWIYGGPAAFLFMLGPLLAERFLAGVERATAGARALVATIFLAALSGVMEAEIERIWQFAVPFAAVAAAPLVRSRRWLTVGLALGLTQAYLIEVLWDAHH